MSVSLSDQLSGNYILYVVLVDVADQEGNLVLLESMENARENIESGFFHHKIVTNILHQHLKNNVITNAIHEIDIKQIKAELPAAKKLAQQAMSKI